ncbi:MAG: hypothetical protein WAU69_00685 [Solirubrobacteraceae bacterium]
MWSDQHELHLQATGFCFDGLKGHPPRQPRPASRSSESATACGISIGTGVARTVRAAQMLIERGVRLDADLAGLDVDLRRLAGARNVASSSALCAGGRMTVARVSAPICKRFRTALRGLLTTQQAYDSINFASAVILIREQSQHVDPNL